MNIIPDSIVVASEEYFSFIVPESETMEALRMPVVPDDFPNESLRGLKIIESKITATKPTGMRVMFKHLPNPRSTVKIAKQQNTGRPLAESVIQEAGGTKK